MEPRADRRSSGWRATSRNMSGASSDAAGGDGPGLRPEDLGAWGRLSADAEFNAKGEAKGPGGVMWGALHSAGFGASCDALGSVPDARRRGLARPSRVRPMLETAATAARGAVRSGSAIRSAAFPPPKCRRASSSRCGHGYKSVPYRRANSIRDPPQQRVRAPFCDPPRRCAVRARRWPLTASTARGGGRSPDRDGSGAKLPACKSLAAGLPGSRLRRGSREIEDV